MFGASSGGGAGVVGGGEGGGCGGGQGLGGGFGFGKLLFEAVAEAHEFVDLGDDAFLLGEWGESERHVEETGGTQSAGSVRRAFHQTENVLGVSATSQGQEGKKGFGAGYEGFHVLVDGYVGLRASNGERVGKDHASCHHQKGGCRNQAN